MNVPSQMNYISAAEAAQILGNDGARVLLAAHAEGRITLTGRILLKRARTAPFHRAIPKMYGRNRVLNVNTNELETEGGTTRHRKLKLDQGLARWTEISISNADVAKLQNYLCSPTYISALARKQCAEWLVTEMPNFDAALTRREDVWPAAKDRFLHLSHRAFIRIWNESMKHTGRTDLSDGGRRPGKR